MPTTGTEEREVPADALFVFVDDPSEIRVRKLFSCAPTAGFPSKLRGTTMVMVPSGWKLLAGSALEVPIGAPSLVLNSPAEPLA